MQPFATPIPPIPTPISISQRQLNASTSQHNANKIKWKVCLTFRWRHANIKWKASFPFF
jgi:hypothetical protein